MKVIDRCRQPGPWLLLLFMACTLVVYSGGLGGGWLFDDYPNIVDNPGVHPVDASMASLARAALSSPASEFKRPLASLSFAANFLASGLDPYSWKLTNVIIHLMNGALVFLLSRLLLLTVGYFSHRRSGAVAAVIAGAWLLLPINLTAVLYVVQRMESMANLFVLTGLIGYVIGRRSMLGLSSQPGATPSRKQHPWRSLALCLTSITAPTLLGVLAKETAVMLPLYAALIEGIIFRFSAPCSASAPKHHDRRIIILFALVLVLPMALGLVWLLPSVLNPETWATRNFSLGTRLLSEVRIIVDYLTWTLLPTPDALSFYHDDFRISSGLLTPSTTLTSLVVLGALITLMIWLRPRRPLAALGIAFFLGCQLLTGTILPLELIYEHRNYFASLGLLLALVPLLAAPARIQETTTGSSGYGCTGDWQAPRDTLPLQLPRHVLLGALMVCWTALTAFTAYSWGDPLRLAEDLASRAPQSPRAQYELGRTYIIYSHYNPASPFTRLAYAPLEASAALPNSSILPEQALIFMNARMRLPLKEAWWNSMIGKLNAHAPGVQDESSLGALTQCARDRGCDLPSQQMVAAFKAALTHPNPSPRLLATYGDYAWNVLDDRKLGESMTADAVKAAPNEPAYQITLIRMLSAESRKEEARKAIVRLETLNIGGRLNKSIEELRLLTGAH